MQAIQADLGSASARGPNLHGTRARRVRATHVARPRWRLVFVLVSAPSLQSPCIAWPEPTRQLSWSRSQAKRTDNFFDLVTSSQRTVANSMELACQK